jgi:hypothetical protein
MLLRTLPLLVLLSAGCSIPTVPCSSPLRPYDSFSVGGYTVRVYEALDSLCFHSSRYFPAFLFVATGKRTRLYVAAWQEFLARFPGPLRPAQKELLRASPARWHDSVVQWRIPLYSGEVSDLQYVTPIRTAYWSVERYHGSRDGEELGIAALQSVPQTTPWDWRSRPPQFWQQLRQQSSAVYAELKRLVVRDLERDGSDAAPAP